MATVSDTEATRASRAAERERVLRVLLWHEPELCARGVIRLRVFGSMARGAAGPGSDVDLIPAASFSLLDHVGLEYDLAELLAREVDVSTAPDKMRPRMRRAHRGGGGGSLLMVPLDLASRLEDTLRAIRYIEAFAARPSTTTWPSRCGAAQSSAASRSSPRRRATSRTI